jgi:hypothetical protein
VIVTVLDTVVLIGTFPKLTGFGLAEDAKALPAQTSPTATKDMSALSERA